MTAFPIGLVTEPVSRLTSSGSDARERVWRALAVVAPIVAAVLSVYVAWNADHPSFPYDEVDQLQMSRLLAGVEVPDVRGAGYYPLWSFLIAPVWWMVADPFTAYAVILGIGIAVSLAAIVPFTFIARRFRLSTAQAVVSASVVIMMPAVAIQADYALSERLLLFTVATAVLAAWRLWEAPSTARAILFGLAVGAMYFTHVRVLAVVLASAVWIVLFALRNWRIAIVGLVALMVSAASAYYFGKHLNILLVGGFDQGESLMDTLRATRPGLLLRSALGQAWSQVVGSFGLVAIGAVALARWSWRELRCMRAGRATYLLAIVVAMYLLTVVKWASEYHLYTRPWRRLDIWVYGRYIDPFTVVLVLIAIAVIIRGIRRSSVVWAGGLSLAVIVPTVYWVALEAPTWAYVTPAHIPGVMPWAHLLPDERFAEGARIVPTLWNENSFWLWASLCALIALVAVFALRRFRVTLTVLIALTFTVASVTGDDASNAFHDLEGDPPVFIEDLREALGTIDPVDVQFDTTCSGDGARDSSTLNYYGYWLLPSILTTFDANTETATADLIISCETAAAPGAADAVQIPDATWRDRTLWVRPGPLAEALQENGMLPYRQPE